MDSGKRWNTTLLALLTDGLMGDAEEFTDVDIGVIEIDVRPLSAAGGVAAFFVRMVAEMALSGIGEVWVHISLSDGNLQGRRGKPLV